MHFVRTIAEVFGKDRDAYGPIICVCIEAPFLAVLLNGNCIFNPAPECFDVFNTCKPIIRKMKIKYFLHRFTTLIITGSDSKSPQAVAYFTVAMTSIKRIIQAQNIATDFHQDL